MCYFSDTLLHSVDSTVIILHSNHFDFDFVAECNVFDSLPHPCVKGMHAYDYTVL